MQNLTPLGATMHIRDLDRQAAPSLRPRRSGGPKAYPARAAAAVLALLRRLTAAGASGRAASRARRPLQPDARAS